MCGLTARIIISSQQNLPRTGNRKLWCKPLSVPTFMSDLIALMLQAALNKAYSETLNSASVLLSKTTEEQSSLTKEVSLMI